MIGVLSAERCHEPFDHEVWRDTSQLLVMISTAYHREFVAGLAHSSTSRAWPSNSLSSMPAGRFCRTWPTPVSTDLPAKTTKWARGLALLTQQEAPNSTRNKVASAGISRGNARYPEDQAAVHPVGVQTIAVPTAISAWGAQPDAGAEVVGTVVVKSIIAT